MANILNIDTSGNLCSVALAINGEITVGLESSFKMDHSTSLAPFVNQCFEYIRNNGIKLDAVSVSNGPGSYTGLRIGLSMAKGIAFAMDIPLISLSTLEIMAVRAMFSYPELTGEELIVPMIDARRMEVYTAVFDCGLKKVKDPEAVILDENTFTNLKGKGKILIIGDGSTKFKSLFKENNVIWLGEKMSHAKFMATLSEKLYREGKFSDVAYTEPSYLKEYQATQPKKRL